MSQDEQDLIQVGRISGLHGVKGWVKIFSYTQPREGILKYTPWLVKVAGQWRPFKLKAGRAQGKGVVAHVEGYDDRDVAATLMNCDIAILREQLPAAKKGEYYWIDLVGLAVVNAEGLSLGSVQKVMPTGANDVLVVEGVNGEELLIPFVKDLYVLDVDLESRSITVDWQLDY
ncbi:MAG: ribosome maturation factor RimM [Gammaproteobacteria bacterium]|nr:ribosome maturation factor RimM [Gammaproteobacteria bacterium]MCF6229231.1 ribosome maturation factor RimM [Gammaproteobacteria bacterium]